MTTITQQDSLYSLQYLKRRHRALRWYHEWSARKRLALIQKHSSLRSGESALEIGCDAGTLLRQIDRTGARAFGIDVNADAVKICANPNVRVGGAEAVPFADSKFDVCIASHVIEHLSTPRQFLSEMARVLVPGGRLILWYPFELFRGMTVLPELLLDRRPLSLARQYHLHRFTPASLRKLAADLPLVHHRSLWCTFGPVPEFMSIYERNR